jgi:hypothetical protein
VQNLVRLLENWSVAGQTVKLFGSVGQLFSSEYFTGTFKPNGNAAGVYQVPVNRIMQFDSALAINPPGGSPTTTNFSKGDYFIWH